MNTMTFIEYLSAALVEAQDGKESNRERNPERARYWAILVTELEKQIAFYEWYLNLDNS